MLEQKSYTVAELFGDKQVHFAIPDYQRGYAWEKKQLDEFWEDISFSDEKKHFFGTLILEKDRDLNDLYQVIDGQQRLLTLEILIFELISRLPENERENFYATFIKNGDTFKTSYYADNSFLSKVFADHEIPNPFAKNVYEKNLWYAKKFFRVKIASLDDSEKFLKSLLELLVFSVQIIVSDFDAQAVFETVNNRGKPLTILEKLKNRLMYLDTRNSNGKLRDEINKTWSAMYRHLGENKNQPLNEDEFISAHLSIYRKPLHGVFSEKGAERKLFQMFCHHPEKFEQDEDRDVDSLKENDQYEIEYSDEIPENPEPEIDSDGKKIAGYIENLYSFCRGWVNILHPSESSEIVKRILMINSTKETKVLLATVAMKLKNQDEKQEEIFEKIEKILFRQSIPEYAAWCATEDSFPEIARRMNLGADDEDYLDYDGLNEMIDSALDSEEHPVEAADVVRAFANSYNYVRGYKGFYRWSAIKYFLFEYEKHLEETPRAKSELITLEDFSAYSVEHVLPQSCEYDFTGWENEISEINPSKPGIAGSDDYKKKSRVIAINSLGNLTLLKTKTEQQLLGKKSWSEKKKLYKNEVSDSYNIREISDYGEWNIQAIYERGEKMADFLAEKLGTEFSENQKKEMLLCKNLMNLVD